jgi:hypothetical protein
MRSRAFSFGAVLGAALTAIAAVSAMFNEFTWHVGEAFRWAKRPAVLGSTRYVGTNPATVTKSTAFNRRHTGSSKTSHSDLTETAVPDADQLVVATKRLTGYVTGLRGQINQRKEVAYRPALSHLAGCA